MNHTTNTFSIEPPNYTQTPNVIFDKWIPYLKEGELKVLLVIVRKTFGWHKTRDKISLSQLQKATGLEKKHITKAVKKLTEKNIINKILEGENGSQSTYYELVISTNSNNSYQCPKDTGGGCPKDTGVLKTPTKESSYSYSLNTNIKKKNSLLSQPIVDNSTTTKKSRSSHSPKARELAEFLFLKIKTFKPDFKSPDMNKWALEFEKMMRLDKREEVKIKELIKWATSDSFWRSNCLSPSKLRKNFDQIELKLSDRKVSIHMAKNKKTAYELKEKHPQAMKKMKIVDKFIINPQTGGEVSLEINPEYFLETLVKLFGGTYEN